MVRKDRATLTLTVEVKPVKTRSVAVASMALIATFGLAACSSGTGTTSSSAADSSAATGAAVSGSLTAEGATSQKNAFDYFKVQFTAANPDATFDYNPTGSGSGQKQFLASTVDFAGSDSPFDEQQAADAIERCGGNPAWHLPMVVGPIAVAYNLDGVTDLTISTATLAKIFLGEITNWNDPTIAGENPGVTLPDQNIQVIFRSEESGTSDNFQKFLAATNPGVWTTSGKSFPTAVGAGANGSTGVTGEVKNTAGAITYVESGYAEQEGLSIAKIDFGNGPVELTPETVNAALADVQFSGEGNDLVVDAEALFAENGAGYYPLVMTTYEIVCSAGYDAEKSALVKAFLNTALSSQDDTFASLGYIPVSGPYKEKLQTAIDAIA